MNSEILDLVERNKKNSRLSAENRKQFMDALHKELSDGHYDVDIEKVLCEGPADLTMKELSLYLSSVEVGDATDYLRRLITSKRFQENKGGSSGTRIVFLVASLVCVLKEQNKLLEYAFTEMVYFAYKRDDNGVNKKVVEQIKNTIFPLFDERNSIINLHYMEENKNWNRVRDLFMEAIMYSEKHSYDRVKKIYTWLKSFDKDMGKYTDEYVTKVVQEQVQSETNVICNESEEQKNINNNGQDLVNPAKTLEASDESVNRDDQKSQNEKTGIQRHDESGMPTTTEKNDLGDEDLKKVISDIVGIVIGLAEVQERMRMEIKTLSKSNIDMQQQLRELRSKEEQQREYIHGLVSEKQTLTAKRTEDEGKINELSMLVEKLKSEVADEKQFADTVIRNREKQLEEQLNKLAAKLRVDYRDFCDAKDISMTIDLGENMRDQLGTVFSVLGKSGIRLSE